MTELMTNGKKLRPLHINGASHNTEPTRERILGDYEYVPFRPDQLITLSQIRGERNVVTNELKEDILFQGLLNPVDVSLVGYELLEEYVSFTNRTWGSGARIEDYLHLKLPDGRFPLLKSGHSRHEAVTELILEERLPIDQRIMTRLSEAKTVQDIIEWQRGENIHSQPPRERTAMALVESYMHGLETGKWSTTDEFIEIQHASGRDATKGALDQALKFAHLPPRIRNFVLAGQVPYLAGVELGATTGILTEFVSRSNGYLGVQDSKLTDEERLKINEIVTVRLDIMCNRIVGDKLNSTAAQKFILGQRNEWTRLVKSMRTGRRYKADAFEFEFGQDQLDIALTIERRRLRDELVSLRRKYSGADIRLFLQLQRGIIPDQDLQSLIDEYEKSVAEDKAKINAGLGSSSTLGANLDDQYSLI